MKFADPSDDFAMACDEACLRSFLAGSKTAFTQAFWENGRRDAGEEAACPSAAALEPSE